MQIENVSAKVLRRRRVYFSVIVILSFIFITGLVMQSEQIVENASDTSSSDVLSGTNVQSERATEVLDRLEVKGRAPKTGYARSQFGEGWASVGGCDMRNIMLNRSMSDVVLGEDGCIVSSGTFQDPYTGKTIAFVRGSSTSNDVQIDHVVALSDAWQKGAQQLDLSRRIQFANDSLNLLAADGPTNQDKSDSDAASWLPPKKNYRCSYVARQIAVKDRYDLWITEAEKAAIRRVLNGCKNQLVPIES